ncbi:adenylosuccinate synthetase [Clostridium tertium]|uniref:adenylosuccinate synthetase n=1 Tax=Clostridium tertium TaxID=1559 RepID=UPI0024B3BC33|nr:adenylosuccinate synthetase [Clostridium tertium]MDI9216423.1 adenylosuccinate synthetase [Clostridium tertium]
MVSVILGGQIGSEGKGKVAAYLAKEFEMSVRTGGPNAGHTVNMNGIKNVMQLVPCAFVNKDCLLALSAGSYISVETLLDEIKRLNLRDESLIIDPMTGIIEGRHIEREAEMYNRRVSTGKGVGQATVDKVLRKSEFKLAKDVPELQKYIKNVHKVVNDYIDNGKNVLIEGTQGFDLSLHHGSYPYVTSRDTTAGTFLGEVGVSPRVTKDIILVLRTYPIRASNGPIFDEVSWDDVTKLANSKSKIIEYTSVTKNVRRVGTFDFELVREAIRINRPTQIALNFVDYINNTDYKVKEFSKLSSECKKFIDNLERLYNVPVTLIGTGENVEDTIDLREEKGVI